MRLILAVLAAAAAGALGAVILGEYEFKGAIVLTSGIVFGLFIAEAALAVHHRPAPVLAAASAAIGLVAMLWSAWISTGHDLSYLGPAGWTAVVLTGAVAGARTGVARREKPGRAAGSPGPEPAPAAPSEDSPP